MKVALLVNDLLDGEILVTLLTRLGVSAVALRVAPAAPDTEARIAVLRDRFDEILDCCGARLTGTRAVAIVPTILAWLTRDPDANERVLATNVVPPTNEAAEWLGRLSIASSGPPRKFIRAIDGKALAATMDLGRLATAVPEFRELVSSLRPAWTSGPTVKRGPGRPPGVQLFQGTGYALCLELLHAGARGDVSTGDLVVSLGRTKTPVLRMIAEAERRGFVRRTSPRGILRVLRPDRLLDDLVIAVRAERARRPPAVMALGTDRDPEGLVDRVAKFLHARGRVVAVTGAAALNESGGEMLIGGPIRAYASVGDLGETIADGYRDRRHPRLILVEPVDESVLHRLRPGTPSLVSRWQAVIDLLASENDREREIGTEVRRRLEATR